MDVVVGRTGVIGTIRGSSSRQASGAIPLPCVLYQPVTVASSSVLQRECTAFIAIGFIYLLADI